MWTGEIISKHKNFISSKIRRAKNIIDDYSKIKRILMQIFQSLGTTHNAQAQNSHLFMIYKKTVSTSTVHYLFQSPMKADLIFYFHFVTNIKYICVHIYITTILTIIYI